MKEALFLLVFLPMLVIGCRDKDVVQPPPTKEPPDTLIPQADWNVSALNPVMEVKSDTNWDGGMVSGPSVILYKDTLRMWYQGSISSNFDEDIHIGYAWSLDGIEWHRRNTPVLLARKGDWDSPHLAKPSIFVDGDTLRMWYGGGNAIESGLMAIGYAVSVDGINWSRRNSPVMLPGNKPWNVGGVVPGPVLKENGVYKMWFLGGINHIAFSEQSVAWSTGYATSPDGINWTIKDEPVLEYDPGSWDVKTAIAGTLFKTDTGYEMWYAGQEGWNITFCFIGYATSHDGLTWEKYDKNPVLTKSKGSVYITEPSVVKTDSSYYMWYSAWHPGPGIHLATSGK